MFKGRAEADSALKFLQKFNHHHNQVREFCEIPVSSIAIGTYLGPMDEVTDAKVTKAVLKTIENGCNFIDTAINYRGQRAERSIGEAIRQGILTGKFKREEIFISSKAGFIPYESKPVQDLKKLFDEEYVNKGVVKKTDLISGCHCLEPKFILNQLDRSLKNLKVETIDLYYLHNPETQLEELPARIFYQKLEDAFEALEGAIVEGKISAYGMATWDGFRDEDGSQTYLSIEECMRVAKKVAQKLHLSKPNFKAIQCPLNLAAPEAALFPNQKIEEGNLLLPTISAAKKLGLSVAVSVPLFQSRLCHDLPEFILKPFPKELSQAHCALAFATSFSDVDAAMVGMKDLEHVTHNLEFLKKAKLTNQELELIANAIVS